MKVRYSALALVLILSGCRQVQLYERLQNIQKAEWHNHYVPTFTFDITDTTKLYNVYAVVRHTNAYPYNNLWVKAGIIPPGDTLRTRRFDLKLAASDKWLGSGMDDIWEHRVELFSGMPLKAGRYNFTLQQDMRQNPLPEIMQVGIRVEPQ